MCWVVICYWYTKKTINNSAAMGEQEPRTSRVHFRNEPLLSGFETDQQFDERRISLIPQVTDLIASSELFGDGKVSVEFAHKGVSSLVCFVETGDNRYVLKVPLSLSDGGSSEAEFLNQWEATGVCVPHVYESGQLGEHAYTIMKHIDAPMLSEAIAKGIAKDTVYVDMGNMLATMHTPKTSGYGRIVEGTPQHLTFREWLNSEDIAKRISTVREHNLLGDEHGPISQVFDNLAAYTENDTSSSYCHFDFSAPNLFATDPLTVFDPSPMLNNGIIDIGRSMLSAISDGQPEAAAQLQEGYFSSGIPHDPKALQAAIILNAYWRFPYAHKKGRTEVMERTREYLIATRHLLDTRATKT